MSITKIMIALSAFALATAGMIACGDSSDDGGQHPKWTPPGGSGSGSSGHHSAWDDDDDDDDEDAYVEETVYNILRIVDQEFTNDNNGTSGADFCSIEVLCGADGYMLLPGTAELKVGEGVCTATNHTGCEATGNRYDDVSRLKFDESNACEKAIDAVSIGVAGVLTVTYNENLAGCDFVIDEFTPASKDKELYKIEVCTADGEDCLFLEWNPVSGAVSGRFPKAESSDK